MKRIVFLIAVPELMAKAKSIAAQTYGPIGSYLAVAIVYFAIVYLMDAALRWLERAARIPALRWKGRERNLDSEENARTLVLAFYFARVTPLSKNNG